MAAWDAVAAVAGSGAWCLLWVVGAWAVARTLVCLIATAALHRYRSHATATAYAATPTATESAEEVAARAAWVLADSEGRSTWWGKDRVRPSNIQPYAIGCYGAAALPTPHPGPDVA